MKKAHVASTLSTLCLLLLPACATGLTRQEDPSPPSRHFLLDLGVGLGTGDYQTDSSNLDDEQDGAFIRGRFLGIADSGIGAGIDISHWTAESLFENIGVEPSDLRSLRVFPHFAARLGGDQFRLTSRLGPLFQEDELEGQVSGDTIGASTVAFAAGFEAEVFLSRERATVSLFGSVLVGFGSTDIEVSPPTYTADSTLFEVEAGLRVTFNQVRFGLGYILQSTETDQSDVNVSNNTVLLAHDYAFSGVMFTVGVVF